MDPALASPQEIARQALFLMAYPFARRTAAVRSASCCALVGVPLSDHEDFEQDAMVALWRALPYYDESRASVRTFAERVIANRLRSLMRRHHSLRRAPRTEAFFYDAACTMPAPGIRIELRLDIWRVLSAVSEMDRAVALFLMDHSAIETSQRLRVSRATVYRAIGRLRAAFTAAGLSPWRHKHEVHAKGAASE